MSRDDQRTCVYIEHYYSMIRQDTDIRFRLATIRNKKISLQQFLLSSDDIETTQLT